MAVSKVIKSTSLIINIENGISASGNVVYKKKSFSNIRTNVDPNKAYAVANAISEVLTAGTGNYYLKDNCQIVQE